MPKGVYDFFCRGAGQPNPCHFASRYIIEQYLWVALLEKAGKAAAVPEYYLATSPRLKKRFSEPFSTRSSVVPHNSPFCCDISHRLSANSSA